MADAPIYVNALRFFVCEKAQLFSSRMRYGRKIKRNNRRIIAYRTQVASVSLDRFSTGFHFDSLPR